jgi:MFS family permease
MWSDNIEVAFLCQDNYFSMQILLTRAAVLPILRPSKPIFHTGRLLKTKIQSDSAWLAGICLSRCFFAFIFTAYSAALPLLRGDWNMSASQAGMIQSAWHAGYLISLFTVGFIADRYGAKMTFLIGSTLASLSALIFAFFADSFVSGLILYGFTGLCSGASYTPGLTLVAERFAPLERGRTMGWFLAAASLGYGASLLMSGILMPHVGWQGAFIAAACGPFIAMLISFWTLRTTPNVIHPHGNQLIGIFALRAVWQNRPAMLLIWAYVFHAWELLGLWAWLPAYLTAAIIQKGTMTMAAAGFGALLTALTYITSMGGSIYGGALSDRWGRTRIILTGSCLSLLCSFLFGWMMALPLWLLVAVGAIYNITAIADSSVYSTALTELVPPHYLGAAYALRSLLGFGAGIMSPWVFGLVMDWVRGEPLNSETMAWGLAWTALGVGAAIGPVMTIILRTTPEAHKMACGKR